MLIVPKNGYYFTNEDNIEYNNHFQMIYNDAHNCNDCMNKRINDLLTPSVTFVVTEKCTLACSYCYEQHKTNKVMTKEIAKQAIDFLLSDTIYDYFSKDIKGFIIDFIGGEPLLEIDLIEYITEYFYEQAFIKKPDFFNNTMFNITSNGTEYLNEKVQKYLKKYKGKVYISITIDGDKKLHDSCRKFHDGRGSHEIVSRSVKHLVANSDKPSTKVTIAHDNLPYFSEAVYYLWHEMNIIFINANCVFENIWQDGDDQLLYDELIKIADHLIDNDLYNKYYISFFNEKVGQPLTEEYANKNYCGGNGAMLAIGTDGKLYPCIRFMQYSLNNQKEHSIGDIYTGININDAWLKDLKNVTIRSQSNEKCINCQIATECGLCTGFNYDEFGTPNKRATYICKMHEARVCANAYYWNKLYKKLGLQKVFKLNINNKYGDQKC